MSDGECTRAIEYANRALEESRGNNLSSEERALMKQSEPMSPMEAEQAMAALPRPGVDVGIVESFRREAEARIRKDMDRLIQADIIKADLDRGSTPAYQEVNKNGDIFPKIGSPLASMVEHKTVKGGFCPMADPPKVGPRKVHLEECPEVNALKFCYDEDDEETCDRCNLAPWCHAQKLELVTQEHSAQFCDLFGLPMSGDPDEYDCHACGVREQCCSLARQYEAQLEAAEKTLRGRGYPVDGIEEPAPKEPEFHGHPRVTHSDARTPPGYNERLELEKFRDTMAQREQRRRERAERRRLRLEAEERVKDGPLVGINDLRDFQSSPVGSIPSPRKYKVEL